jgi:integration host factor subunit alpha
MDAIEFEALLSAQQRRAMMHDTPPSNAEAPTGTPTLRKAELIEMLCDRAGLDRQEAKEMLEAFFRGDARRAGKRRKREAVRLRQLSIA